MPQTGYDRDADERHAPTAGGESFEDQVNGDFSRHDIAGMEHRASAGAAADQQSLRDQEEGSAPSDGSRPDSSDASNSSSPTELASDEKDAGESSGLFKSDSKDANGPGRKEKFVGTAKKLGKNKLLVGGVLAAFGGLGGLIILAFVLLGSLSIPNLANNIVGYQFAKVSRQYARNTERIASQALAIQATSDENYKQLKDKASLKNKAAAQISKLDKVRPAKIAANLRTEANISYLPGKTGIFGRETISAIKIGDNVFTKPTVTGPARFVPVLNKVLEARNQNQFIQSFSPALESALRSSDTGTIARSIAANDIRKTLGISLKALVLSKVVQTSDGKAAKRSGFVERDTAINANLAPDNATSTEIKDVVKNVDDAHAQALKDNAAIDEALAKKGILRGVREAITNGFEQSAIAAIGKEVLSFLNPVLAVAGPFCVIYDGSMDRSGGTVDNSNRQKMAAFSYLTTAADQIKYGGSDTKLATAAGVYSDSMGDTTSSVPIQRGYTGVDNTAAAPPAEASAGGQYSLLDALGFPSDSSAVANKVCPVVNNPFFIAASTGATLLATVFSDGAVSASAKTAGDVAKKLAEKEASSLAERFFIKGAIQAGRAKDLILGQVPSTAAIVGLTFLAKYIVANRSNEVSNGNAMETDAANLADSGGNLMGNEISRKGTYGRPLLSSEVVAGNQADIKYALQLNAPKNAYERYLSPKNANSLVAKMAFSLTGALRGPIADTMTKLMSRLFNPLNMVAAMTDTFSGHAAAAATTTATSTNYNAVQFAWTADEEKLIDSNDSYTAIANARILDQNSSAVNEIDSTYGKCFTSNMGDLLSNGDIKRDEAGNVLNDDSTCSPKMFGVNNPKYGDLAFRWRLDKRYNSGTDDQLSIQDPSVAVASTGPTTPTPGAGGSSGATGDYVLPVDQKWYDQHPEWFSAPHHDTPAIDIPVPEGTPIYSMTAGTILRAPNEGGYGEGVMIQGVDGFQYIYGHGTDGGSIPKAAKGDTVVPGQLIMHAGNTGHSFGAHLHLNIQTSFDASTFRCPQKLLVAIATKAPLPPVGSLPQSGCTN
jgi:murein DD-endopeptidase MepM/ murein hydrolase activator NlpD